MPVTSVKTFYASQVRLDMMLDIELQMLFLRLSTRYDDHYIDSHKVTVEFNKD